MGPVGDSAVGLVCAGQVRAVAVAVLAVIGSGGDGAQGRVGDEGSLGRASVASGPDGRQGNREVLRRRVPLRAIRHGRVAGKRVEDGAKIGRAGPAAVSPHCRGDDGRRGGAVDLGELSVLGRGHGGVAEERRRSLPGRREVGGGQGGRLQGGALWGGRAVGAALVGVGGAHGGVHVQLYGQQSSLRTQAMGVGGPQRRGGRRGVAARGLVGDVGRARGRRGGRRGGRVVAVGVGVGVVVVLVVGEAGAGHVVGGSPVGNVSMRGEWGGGCGSGRMLSV